VNRFKPCLNNEARKKRFGQYFTDDSIANLLIKLADIKRSDTVIDPMAGSGNMLAPLLELGHDPFKVYGIEIDPVAGKLCDERLMLSNFVINNAFNKTAYEKFTGNCKDGWDVVITNPPYVRYQSMRFNEKINIDLPNAKSIREDLLETIDSFKFLDEKDRNDFKIIVQSYSGLADLAVPSWILCSAMLKVGGRLAIVVPDTWLNRQYASVVQYMLLKWFRIEYVIEDVNRVWFADAQVKTNLVIAKRIPRKKSIYCSDYYYSHIEVYGNINKKLGAGLPMVEKENLDVAIKSRDSDYIKDIKYEMKNIEHMITNFLENYKLDWINELEDRTYDKGYASLPYELTKLLGNHKKLKTISLEELGISVGQGLRTGANKFFYLTHIETLGEYEIVQPHKYFGFRNLKVPSNLLYKVVRKQSDINDALFVDRESIKGRVLYIQDAITEKDMTNTDSELTQKYSVLNDDLADFIKLASLTPINENNPNKLIPQLSAVKPNDRIEEIEGTKIKRYWYMLPRFTDRHIPDLFIPRINNDSPNTYLLDNREVVIDANFSTLWIEQSYLKYKLAYFAILNSYWVKAYLESIATVMGGGALKVEASHIRKIKIPLLNEKELEVLNTYGDKLSKVNNHEETLEIICKIDNLLLSKTNICSESLRKYVRDKVTQRKN